MMMSGRKLLAMEGHAPAPKLAEEERAVETELALVMAALLCAFMTAMALHSLLRCVFRRFRPRRGDGNGDGNDNDTVVVLQLHNNSNAQNDHDDKGTGEGGLDAAALAALHICKHRQEQQQQQQHDHHHDVEEGEGEGKEEGEKEAWCAICLTRLLPGDMVRVMGVCCHRFHVPCIDKWLASKSSCPICRRSLVPAPAPAPVPVDAVACGTVAAAEATATETETDV